MPSQRIVGILALLLFASCTVLGVPQASAADFVRDNYYWYVPEHEKYSRTEFYTQPDFNSPQVRITRTQRFRYGAGRRGWQELEFDSGQRAFIHRRLLRTLLHDPSAVDPWYEFERASVFAEDPAKIEARLKRVRTEPSTADSKVPAWKRYKDGWSINKGRAGSRPAEPGADPESSVSRAPEKKGRSRHPLLPPIGAEPPAEAAERSGPAPEPDPGATGSR